MAAVSVRDVAQRAGVSVGTVSNVMNRPDKVSPATIESVKRAISELGFVRNDAARQLRAGRSRAVGLVILDVGNPFFAELARGAEDQAARAGFSIILGNSDEKADRESRYLDLFEEQRMHGVLISPFGEVTGRLRRLRERGIPAVLVDRTSPDSSFSSVSVDDIAGGRLAVEHLIAIGRRRIAFVGGPMEIRQVTDRLEGSRRATAAHPGISLEVLETGSPERCGGPVLSAAAILERPRARTTRRDIRGERPHRGRPAAGPLHAGIGASCPTRSPSSGTTTSVSPRPPSCRCRRFGSRAPSSARRPSTSCSRRPTTPT